MVSGRIAVRGEFNPAAAYGVSELGLLGRVGAGAEELYAYWTDGGELLASTVAGTRLVIAGSLDIAPAAAEVAVAIDAAVSLGDPALSGAVTAVGARVDALETADTALDGRVDVLEAAKTALEAADRALRAADTVLGERVTAIEDADFAAQIAALEGRSVIRSIQRGSVTVDGGAMRTTTVAISSVNTGRAFVNPLFDIDGWVPWELASATQLIIRSHFSGGNRDIHYEVIEFV